MKFTIELEQEPDGSCWVAEVMELPGCIIDGATKEEAIKNAKALALKIIAERIEFEKESEQADITDLSFVLANG